MGQGRAPLPSNPLYPIHHVPIRCRGRRRVCARHESGRKRYHQIVNAAQAGANSPVTKPVTASARRALANKIDPEPRMREVKDLRKGRKLRGGSAKQIEDTIYEPDQD